MRNLWKRDTLLHYYTLTEFRILYKDSLLRRTTLWALDIFGKRLTNLQRRYKNERYQELIFAHFVVLTSPKYLAYTVWWIINFWNKNSIFGSRMLFTSICKFINSRIKTFLSFHLLNSNPGPPNSFLIAYVNSLLDVDEL